MYKDTVPIKCLMRSQKKEDKGDKEFIIYISNKHLLNNYWHKIGKEPCTHEAS